MSSRFSAALIAVVAVLLIAGSTQAAPIIFDDFNTSAGHFGYNPTFSSTSNVSSASTATYVTTGGGIDGGNFMRINAVMSTVTPARIRWLSGGPPYNTTNGGAPVGNVSFNVAAAQDDGKIGFYFRTTTSGMTLALNLDQPGNTGATMVGSVPKTVTAGLADGQWHLFEWNLDVLSDWGAVAGIGGGNTNLEGFNHTIDSIYIQGLTAANVTAPIDIDFVGKTNSSVDSVSTLVPEPATLGLLAMLSPLVIRRRRIA
jgi:hypothetical protein